MLTPQTNDGITIYSALERQTFMFNNCVDLNTCKNSEGKTMKQCVYCCLVKKKNYALRLPRFLLRSVLVWELTGQNVKELD